MAEWLIHVTKEELLRLLSAAYISLDSARGEHLRWGGAPGLYRWDGPALEHRTFVSSAVGGLADVGVWPLAGITVGVFMEGWEEISRARGKAPGP